MLLERNQAVVGAVFVALLLIGTFLSLTVKRDTFTRGTDVAARFTDAAGLQEGDSVLVAGVRAGIVQSVAIDRDLVLVRLRIETPMPSDSRVRIVLQNFLGKRAVVVEAGDAWDEVFQNGDVVPVERTSTPVDFPELGDETVELLGESDVDALQSLITAVADVTEGQHDEVAELLSGVQRLSEVLVDKREQLNTVLVRSEELFSAFTDKDEELVTIIDQFGSTLDRLANRRAELETLLVETARTTNLTANLIGEERDALDRVLAELGEDLAIIDQHQVDLAHVLAYGGVSFLGFSEIGRGNCPDPNSPEGCGTDNPAWGNIFADSLGPLGVDALLGCGGAIDQVFDQILGPDPRPCEEQGSDADDPPPPAPRPPSMRALFEVAR